MIAGARLALLSGLSGVSAGAHLLAIRLAGSTAGQMLLSRSSLPEASAAQHLLDDGAVVPVPPAENVSKAASSSRSSGPDAQVSMADWLRRFGRQPEAGPPPAIGIDDDEALALILCALAAESLTSPQF